MKFVIAALFSTFLLTANALTIDSITFDDKITVDGKEMVLNGVGIRKATFLKIKVYYGALYLKSQTKNPNDFLTTSDPKQVVMHFVRDVSAKDLISTYREAFEGANKENYKEFLPTLEQMLTHIKDIKKGEKTIFTFTTNGVRLLTAGTQAPLIGDQKFAEALLKIWFINPIDKDLANGLLGK